MRDYSKFYTPDQEASDLVTLAKPIQEGMKFLEPSFGNGNIIKAIKRFDRTLHVTGYEVQDEPFTEFFDIVIKNSATANTVLYNLDFLATNIKEKYDRIIANPPFDGDKWISHLIKMYYLLSATGRLVCIVPRQYILTGGDSYQLLYSYFGEQLKQAEPIDNWVTNSDGSTTDLYIIVVQK